MSVDEPAADTQEDDMIGVFFEDIGRLEAELEGLEDRLSSQVDDLVTRVNEIDERTKLLQLVEQSDELTAEERSKTLLTHMQRRIARQDSNRTFLTRDQAEEALHYPDLDRTTFYSDMQRCERLVGDRNVCWYVSARDSQIGEAQIYLDLSETSLHNNLTNGGAE